MKGKLILEDGTIFEGQAFGADLVKIEGKNQSQKEGVMVRQHANQKSA